MFSPYIIVRILFGLSLCVNNVHNSIVQYNTGTIITREEVVNIGMVHVNMVIRIPQLPSYNNVQYLRPCDTVHEFTSDLLRTNITASTALIEKFTHICKDFERLKRLNLGIKNYYIHKIDAAETSINILNNRPKRSIFSMIKHGLNFGDYDTQQKIIKNLGTLEDIQFNLDGQLDHLQYRITHVSRRINILETAAQNTYSTLEKIDKYLSELVDNTNGKEILEKYNHVMLQEALNSGIITNQYLNIATNEIEASIAALTTIYKHYLPYQLVSAQELQVLLQKLQSELNIKHPVLQLVHQTVHDYYSIDNVHFVLKNHSFYIQIPLLLNFMNQDYTIYKLTAFPLPIPGNDTIMMIQHQSKIAVNHRLQSYFIPKKEELNDCVGEHRKICNSVPAIYHISTNQKTCELSIIMNNTDLVK